MRLTAPEMTSVRACVQALNSAEKRLVLAVKTANADVSAALDRLNEAVSAYNLTARYAETFRNRVAERLRDEYDEKSEKWQEGDAGQSALGLVEEWENADVTEAEPAVLPDLTLEDIGVVAFASKTFYDLPEES